MHHQFSCLELQSNYYLLPPADIEEYPQAEMGIYRNNLSAIIFYRLSLSLKLVLIYRLPISLLLHILLSPINYRDKRLFI